MGATPRVGTRLLLATHPNFNFFFNLPNSKNNNNCQDGRVKDQTELPRGLRGVDQQADQHGILCLVRLSFHGKQKHDMNFTLKMKSPHCGNEHCPNKWKDLTEGTSMYGSEVLDLSAE